MSWLALVVVLTVAAGSQSALLNGLRRVGDLARVSIFSGMAATVAGVAALLFLGTQWIADLRHCSAACQFHARAPVCRPLAAGAGPTHAVCRSGTTMAFVGGDGRTLDAGGPRSDVGFSCRALDRPA